MDARQLMQVEVVTVPPDLSLELAHKVMKERALRHLPVVSGKKLAGILSERDVYLAIGRDLNGTFIYPPVTVGQAMSLAPISAGPGVPVAELAKTMIDQKIDALPIIGPQDELVGLVTSTDLVRLLLMVPSEPRLSMAFQIRRAAELHARA
jgi:CBS domain-containing protein